jgi:Spy/CpxP family protein refolding chaperone
MEGEEKAMKAFGTVGLGLAVAGALLAGTAMAQAPGGMGMGAGGGMGPGFGEHRPPMERAFGLQGDHGRWWNNPKVVERLKLTDEQRKAFDGILLEHREKLIDLRASVEKAELEMEPLIGTDQPDEARILSQIDKVAQARAELEKANARFLLAIRNKLTPEQWKQVQAFRASHGQERGGRESGRDGKGPGGWEPGGPHHHQGPPPPPPPPPAPQGSGSDASPATPAAGTGDEQ